MELCPHLECAKIFQQFVRTPKGQYFNRVRWDIVSGP
jgi:hypothetical protein